MLIEQGYDSSIDGEAYSSIFFQNANHSVRVTDDFMRAVEENKDWWTKNVIDGQPNEKLSARELLDKIADSTWQCGDPGHAVRHDREPLAHLQEHGADQCQQSRAANTCSWTIRRATWLR